MSKVADFTESELNLIHQTLKERYEKDVEAQLADVEIRLSPGDHALTECPALFWSERGANFVLVKSGENEFRCQFYYRGNEQFGTGRDTYDELGDCIVTLLQAQADHEREQNLKQSGD
jgi:hypothetical protein